MDTSNAEQAKQLYRQLLTTQGCTWSAGGVTLPPTAPPSLHQAVTKWSQWLLAARRLHVLLHKPVLLDDEADEAEFLARRLNHPIRRFRMYLNATDRGWLEL